ncbi:RagB/SusD family nutrient uptake outer membrane protein [Chitinophaga cymbidii]|uniref:Membrane protein n=1 Tax=Chitinophaga cymbidii TaxID=1096750 RepID=A0A512RGC5_9BACT|nr:RagB/SusD family nutrient uptake outer membrane protein [Chitinophaga cymbidii]GEP94708.1 membrane protein [Chitinophaga cymbidii]
MKIIYLLIPCSLLMASCGKLLETTPTDFLTTENYYKTEEQLNYALHGVYDRLGASELYGDKISWTYNSSTDESYQRSMPSVGVTVNSYEASSSDINNFWRVCYEGIERANVLLANIDRPVMPEKNRDVIRGEALFLRAYYYFILVSNFGDVPMKLEPTEASAPMQFPRTPSAEVYAKIIEDMTTAESLLQEQTITKLGFSGRISKTAIQAVLARVNLYMAGYPLKDESKYEDALNWAKKVVESGEHMLNPSYEQVFINYAQDKYDVKESLWEIEFFGNSLDTYRETGRIGNNIGVLCQDVELGQCFASVNATIKLYNLYEEGDHRRDWNCAPFVFTGRTNAVKTPVTDNWTKNIGKWRREYETLTPKHGNNTPQNFAIIRYSDVLLMLAEAENHVHGGPTAVAYDALNQVRRRAYGKPLDVPDACDAPAGMGQAGFLKFIQDERSRELCVEAVRRYDLIRWGIYLSTMKEFAEYIMSNAPEKLLKSAIAAQNLEEKHLLFPIPLREMSVNSALKGHQNPGW